MSTFQKAIELALMLEDRKQFLVPNTSRPTWKRFPRQGGSTSIASMHDKGKAKMNQLVTIVVEREIKK